MDTASLVIKMTGALALILGIMFLLIFFLKKWNRITGKSSPGYIDVIENKPLLPKRYLSLVRIADKYFLVGSTEQNMNLLGTVTRNELEKFNSILKKDMETKLNLREKNT